MGLAGGLAAVLSCLCPGAAAIFRKRGGLLRAGLIFLFLSITSGHWVRAGPCSASALRDVWAGFAVGEVHPTVKSKGWGQAPSEFELRALVSAKGIPSQADFPLLSTVGETVASTRAGGTDI